MWRKFQPNLQRLPVLIPCTVLAAAAAAAATAAARFEGHCDSSTRAGLNRANIKNYIMWAFHPAVLQPS
jgi:hypothetical protein